MERIFIPNYGGNLDNVIAGIKTALQKCMLFQCTNFTIVTPVKSSIDGVLSDIFNREDIRKLHNGKAIDISNGISMTHESVSTIKKKPNTDIVLALHISVDSVYQLDGLAFKCMIYIPWLIDEGTPWVSRWNAEIAER